MSKKSTKPTLSLAMFVKNEAATLERCLSCARPYVDEIIVVDTGSTDGTQDIARAWADRFEEMEWPNSFAVMRERTFAMATGDFVMYLDGDEYIPEQHSWNAIHQAIADKKTAAVVLRLRNVLAENSVTCAENDWQVRVFRNDPSIFWEGKVHNQIWTWLNQFTRKTGKRIVKVEAEFVHTGYALTTEQAIKKYEPRIALLKYEIENATTPINLAYYQYQLGIVLVSLRRFAEAAEVLNQVDFTYVNEQNISYTRLIAAQANLAIQQTGQALVHAEVCLRKSPNEPYAYFINGLVLYALHRKDEALYFLTEAYVRNQNQGGIRFPLNEALLLRVIGDVCAKTGRLEKARFFLTEYLKLRPEDERAVRLVAELTGAVHSAPVEI